MILLCCLGMMANVVKVLEQAVLNTDEEAEVCGLLGGYLKGADEAVAMAVRPLSNLSLRRHSFAVDVEEFCRERDAIEYEGLVPLALYHSHLSGSTQPSFRDRKLPWITDLALLIIARSDNRMNAACYCDIGSSIVPVEVIIERGCYPCTTF